MGNILASQLGHGAVISADGAYRYKLTRTLDAYWLPTIAWVMLNPSFADATVDDPTIRKVVGFSRRWEFGKVEVYNLFALRSTDPTVLDTAAAPVGPENRDYIWSIPENREVVAAWGAWLPDGHDDWLNEVWQFLLTRKTCCIGKAGNGEPRHPSRAGYNSPRERWVQVGPRGIE